MKRVQSLKYYDNELQSNILNSLLAKEVQNEQTGSCTHLGKDHR